MPMTARMILFQAAKVRIQTTMMTMDLIQIDSAQSTASHLEVA